MAGDVSHSAGDTISALNRISAFNFDLVVIDWARFSKSSYHIVPLDKMSRTEQKFNMWKQAWNMHGSTAHYLTYTLHLFL